MSAFRAIDGAALSAPESATAPPAAAAGGSGTALPRRRGARRARVRVQRVRPWTVCKLAAVASVTLYLVWLLAVGMTFVLLRTVGAVGRMNRVAALITGSGAHAVVTPGVVFGAAALVGAFDMALFIGLATAAAAVYNHCADLVGGVEITLSELH